MEVAPRLIDRSEQAVVPVNYGFPDDWKNSRDIYPPYTKHFPNICDVVYRNKFAITLNNKMVSPLKQDREGIFRLLKTSGLVNIHDDSDKTQQLMIDFEGKINDVKLQVNNQFYQGEIAKNGMVRMVLNVSPENRKAVNLLVMHPVKLRSIKWEPAVS